MPTKRAPDPRTAPERVRRYLDKHEWTEVSAAAIWHTFGLSSPARGERERVAQRLVDAGVAVEPPLRDLDDPETRITLRLADPEPEPAAARPEPAAVTRSRGSAWQGIDRDLRERLLLGVGALAIALSLFLPWYTGRRGGIEIPDLSTGWQWLGVLDVYLVAVAIAACVLLVAMVRARPESVTALAWGTAVAAVLGVVAVLYRLLAPPDDVFAQLVLELEVGVGPFVCLLGTAGVAVGAIARAAPSLRFIQSPLRGTPFTRRGVSGEAPQA